jgi:hypothetical protein
MFARWMGYTNKRTPRSNVITGIFISSKSYMEQNNLMRFAILADHFHD